MEFSDGLWARVVETAHARGYASAQQYLTDLIERDLTQGQSSVPSDAEIEKKMEDLGYLDFGRDI
jgi:hypothetical protein